MKEFWTLTDFQLPGAHRPFLKGCGGKITKKCRLRVAKSKKERWLLFLRKILSTKLSSKPFRGATPSSSKVNPKRTSTLLRSSRCTFISHNKTSQEAPFPPTNHLPGFRFLIHKHLCTRPRPELASPPRTSWKKL